MTIEGLVYSLRSVTIREHTKKTTHHLTASVHHDMIFLLMDL